LPAVGWRRFTVGEVNAFGDLLPRLTGLPGSGAEGLDTYAAQVAAVLGAPARPHHRTKTPARSSRPSLPSPPAPQHRTGPGHAVA
ncbi:hypothetical protein GTY54_14815, partial [Streptomyces sp. SID625]|nr:hypothetical protein [Streptomyces sp. SID625]